MNNEYWQRGRWKSPIYGRYIRGDFFSNRVQRYNKKRRKSRPPPKVCAKLKKVLRFWGQKGLNIDRDRMKRARIVEQGTDVGNGEPTLFAGCGVVRSYAPRVHQLLKEIGGVLFTKMSIQATVHFVEGDFVLRIHTIRILDVFR